MSVDQCSFSPTDWDDSVTRGAAEPDELGIPDLFILVCLGRALLLGKITESQNGRGWKGPLWVT